LRLLRAGVCTCIVERRYVVGTRIRWKSDLHPPLLACDVWHASVRHLQWICPL